MAWSRALPKLIMRCQSLGLVPRWASEKLFDLNDKPIEIESSGGALVPFWPGHSVPSCGNCRVLVPLMLYGIHDYATKVQLREEAQRRHHAAWEQYQQFLEEERREENEARLMIVQAGFAAALNRLGDGAAVIDMNAAFTVDGISAAVGSNLAETFLDNYEARLFEMFFAIWKKVIYQPPKRNPLGESELRGQFSDDHPTLRDLLDLWYAERYTGEIDWDNTSILSQQAMTDTVAGKRQKRQTK